MKLHGKTIVITGSSSGIGGEVARLARFEGARVIGIDRNDTLLTLDGFVKMDLGDPAVIDAAITALPDRIDGLVNAAGVPGTVNSDIVARVNYLGLRHLTEALVPRMLKGASIVNIASILGADWPHRLDAHKELAAAASFVLGKAWLDTNPVQQENCYQYFKEALIVWTKKRSLELFMQDNIRMNSVAPGPVFTPILGDFVSMLGQERVDRDSALVKRPALPDEIAGPIVFLLSDDARWIVGANLPIDGGIEAAYV
ncbi:coniferyl-alcohol dehydrogenase [Neorhizobium galegae]|uniref:3-alpha-hydroxysteroid dehydrogenase n=1 Tax=Neorhizobium galegae bv. officinalis bv. officinalis str. HAMBI 1141 TaxID=1028801 RepID=A0A068TJZ7_NEOGA|nr:coniferyl-alcohol dehydrogenase [Neorhizobium galegae]CDZ30242.1 3-alpha-hydroxysteroid dehydrogenase [Neorhizobium galegae bv. officinalis]MCQ1769572.1 coniferyl-alcohol dehydrogenase [Neorhizobium galegae]MCQ1781296.1 coniferyl-alcohol dehydrogenase [Neorhizobium galegae]MCQ1799607.1 coniferyl-alcohol dehydrogenase [Neorhizobium galegae]MCQ1849237.1 coniferyl-alcohol dehydrogenase [Neorhizobium galegae]